MIVRLSSFFGWVFLAIGILGFVPGITTDGVLIGVFRVNPIHNLVHLITGVAFLWAWSKSECAAMRTFQVFGVIYGLITIWGFVQLNAFALGPMAINPADTVFHLIVSVVALYAGFLEPARHPVHCPAS